MLTYRVTQFVCGCHHDWELLCECSRKGVWLGALLGSGPGLMAGYTQKTGMKSRH